MLSPTFDLDVHVKMLEAHLRHGIERRQKHNNDVILKLLNSLPEEHVTKVVDSALSKKAYDATVLLIAVEMKIFSEAVVIRMLELASGDALRDLLAFPNRQTARFLHALAYAGFSDAIILLVEKCDPMLICAGLVYSDNASNPSVDILRMLSPEETLLHHLYEHCSDAAFFIIIHSALTLDEGIYQSGRLGELIQNLLKTNACYRNKFVDGLKDVTRKIETPQARLSFYQKVTEQKQVQALLDAPIGVFSMVRLAKVRMLDYLNELKNAVTYTYGQSAPEPTVKPYILSDALSMPKATSAVEETNHCVHSTAVSPRLRYRKSC